MKIVKTALILWGVFSAIIIFVIIVIAILVFSKNTFLETADGKESNYFKKAMMIHYRQYDNVFSLIYSPVSGADYRTFKPITSYLGKDKKFIYYRDIKQPEVDCKTFEVTKNDIMRDKNFVYRINYDTEHLVAIEGADPKTFENISSSIGKDSAYIYFGLKRQPHVDYKTFEYDEKTEVPKDKDHLYITDGKQQLLIPDYSQGDYLLNWLRSHMNWQKLPKIEKDMVFTLHFSTDGKNVELDSREAGLLLDKPSDALVEEVIHTIKALPLWDSYLRWRKDKMYEDDNRVEIRIRGKDKYYNDINNFFRQ